MSMAWFRWHHGSVNDPKFALVAKRAETNLAAVLGVWTFMLEAASQSDDRGHIGEIDFEAIDLMLGLDDGITQKIHDQMIARNLLTSDGHVASWEKRQPKRERETQDVSTERVRKHRAKNAEPTQDDDKDGVTDGVTPCNASNDQKKPRGEEIRVDKNTTPTPRAKRVSKFEIPDDWQPEDYFLGQMAAAGLPKELLNHGSLVEFISYWQTRDSPPVQSQKQWEHKFLNALINQKNKGVRHGNHSIGAKKLTSFELVEQANTPSAEQFGGFGSAFDVEDFARID